MTQINVIHMPSYIKEEADFAVMLAKDGAYHSAAEKLEELAKIVKAHAKRVSPDFGPLPA